MIVRILWVDDDAADLRYLVADLETEGFDVECVGNMADARSRLEAMPPVDAIILDIILPPKRDMTAAEIAQLPYPCYGGLDFLRWANGRKSRPPVVVITKVSNELIMEQIRRMAPEHIWPKELPTAPRLARVLRRILAEAASLDGADDEEV